MGELPRGIARPLQGRGRTPLAPKASGVPHIIAITMRAARFFAIALVVSAVAIPTPEDSFLEENTSRTAPQWHETSSLRKFDGEKAFLHGGAIAGNAEESNIQLRWHGHYERRLQWRKAQAQAKSAAGQAWAEREVASYEARKLAQHVGTLSLQKGRNKRKKDKKQKAPKKGKKKKAPPKKKGKKGKKKKGPPKKKGKKKKALKKGKKGKEKKAPKKGKKKKAPPKKKGKKGKKKTAPKKGK